MSKVHLKSRFRTYPDADMQAVPKALTRAAQRAREIAERTGTELVVRDAEEDHTPNETR